MSSKTFASQQSEITTKKKFGKNLSRQLSKPPPPTLGADKPSSASRNGLLLLSTKRQSTSGPTATCAGGILANKSLPGTTAKSLPSLGLHNKSNASTHDALLGAVVGASRAELQEPDAWGVADKSKSPELDATPAPKEEPAPQPLEDMSSPAKTASYDADRYENDLPSTDWDEYGGRGASPEKNMQTLFVPDEPPAEDEQKATMARKARERAAAKQAEEGNRQSEQQDRVSQKLSELDQKTREATKPRTLFDPNQPPTAATTPEAPVTTGKTAIRTHEVDSYSRQPIQFSDFNDRDRGDRITSATPRMLFDPKSGSMVAVPTKDDGSGRGRKERGKKGKTTRDKEGKLDTRQDVNDKRKGKREKKAGNDLANTAKSDSKKGTPRAARKFPRTCGVLYTRDSKGGVISADDCDGDLGYGSHSVPGGRIKNADAYLNFVENESNNNMHGGSTGTLDKSFENSEDVMLQTGYSVPEAQETAFEWVKATDKIELMTGLDESPTLQATAKEWAPTKQVLPPSSGTHFSGLVDTALSYDEDDDDAQDDGPVSIPMLSASVYYSLFFFQISRLLR